MSWGGTRRSLFFSYQPGQPSICEAGLSSVEKDKTRLSPADVWNFLLSLTETDVPTSSRDAQKSGKLKHFKASDFEQTNAALLGEGASYRVERGALAAPPNGKSELVAVKRLNIFRTGGAAEHSRMSSAALQSSIATILKELRILTHPPLHGHRNIATLLGYRSEFISTDSEGGPSQQRNFEISLVAEFAPHGTLIDFVTHRGKTTSQESDEKRSKAVGSDGNEFFVDLLHSNSGKETSRCDLLTKARFMHDIASGLQALHGSGVAHGDVKLENTLVYDDPHRGQIAKLSDFGHALLTVSEASNSEQRYLGTMPLIAPEVWRSRSSAVAEISKPIHGEDFYKCDIFSYGLLIWELILDGIRYTSTLGDVIVSDTSAERWAWLDKLPKDELLRRALVSLREGSQASDKVLLGTLTRILEATLRDNPGERKDIDGVIRIFREQGAFRDDGAR
jgi:serine/threonine protein kinase